MKVFCLHFSEGTRIGRKIKSKNLLSSEECWVGATGNKVWGRAVLSQPEELTPVQIELSFYIWPIGFWALVYLLKNLPWYFIHKELFHQTCYFCRCWARSHKEQLSHFARRELITFPAQAFHTQREFLFLIRRKAPIVESCYQIRRLTDINKGSKNTLAVVTVPTFVWASEIPRSRPLKVNIFTTLEKQKQFLKIHWVSVVPSWNSIPETFFTWFSCVANSWLYNTHTRTLTKTHFHLQCLASWPWHFKSKPFQMRFFFSVIRKLFSIRKFKYIYFFEIV